MASTTIKYFEYGHLPVDLQGVSQLFSTIAKKLEAELPDSAEKSAGMRKLLEAKDCFVRAQMDTIREAEENK